MTSGSSKQKRVVLGKVGKVHGIKGWLRLHSHTSPPDNILDYPELGAIIKQKPLALKIDDSRFQNSTLLVHFSGYDDPESSQDLVGTELWTDSSLMPTLDEGEFYWHQLQGMDVVNLQQEMLGKVSKLLETGANDVLVVSATAGSIDKRERLIPYLKEKVIKNVDIDANLIQVDWEASYLD